MDEYKNVIDPEVKEYFREFTSRKWSKGELAKRSGFSAATFYHIAREGTCSDRVKACLKHLYKNPEGNYSNSPINPINTLFDEQAKKRISNYLEDIQDALLDHQQNLENLIHANKNDFVSLCIKTKKSENKVISIIKNKLKPHSLIKISNVKDFAESMWSGLDELMVNMS